MAQLVASLATVLLLAKLRMISTASGEVKNSDVRLLLGESVWQLHLMYTLGMGNVKYKPTKVLNKTEVSFETRKQRRLFDVLYPKPKFFSHTAFD